MGDDEEIVTAVSSLVRLKVRRVVKVGRSHWAFQTDFHLLQSLQRVDVWGMG
jgi:hypothetical protein